MQGGQGRTYVPVELLRTVITILDEGSFTKAGQTLGLTQSAISAQIKRLRQLVGDDVFARSGGGTKLTERGKIVERYARRILDMNDQLLSLSGGGPVAPLVRVGLPVSFAGDILVNAFKSCTGAAKGVQVHLQCARSEELLKQLDTGFLDMAMVIVAPTSRSISSPSGARTSSGCARQTCTSVPEWRFPTSPGRTARPTGSRSKRWTGRVCATSCRSPARTSTRAAPRSKQASASCCCRSAASPTSSWWRAEGFLPEVPPQRAGICVRDGFDREAFAPLLAAFEAAVRPAEPEIAKICGANPEASGPDGPGDLFLPDRRAAKAPRNSAGLASRQDRPNSSTRLKLQQFSYAQGRFRGATPSAKLPLFQNEARRKSRPRAVPGPRSNNGNRSTELRPPPCPT